MTATRKARLWCAGCGREAGTVEVEPFPFRCVAASPGDDIDHVMRRTVHVSAWRKRPVAYEPGDRSVPPPFSMYFPNEPAGGADELSLLFSGPAPGIPHPFLRYRRRLYSYHLARACKLGDAGYTALVGELDERIEEIEGHGLLITPCVRQAGLSRRLGFDESGGLWIKDETSNVAGSHKARHLFGVMIYQTVVEALLARGLVSEDAPAAAHIIASSAAPLAIASCGNAALAAAVVAKAARRQLTVHIPASADSHVVTRLRELGAEIVVCERREGETGDPCYLRFRESIETGAIPFCCQGPANGITIEGGETLAYEMLDAAEAGFDRVFVQVGGGALASACARGFEEALAAGLIHRLPRMHAVQTEGAWPLARAYDGLASRLLVRLDLAGLRGTEAFTARQRGEIARAIAERAEPGAIHDVIRYAARHRSEFMWPWETEPRSIAYGILDDETYDWLAVLEGMLTSGGWPIVVGEAELRRANELARETTGLDVCHTGSAGLAGLLTLLEGASAADHLRRERVAVLFTGRRR